MAKIVINEISSNYTYNIGSNSYATVALPITAAWGPCFYEEDSESGKSKADVLDETVWEKFPANQAGLEAFVSTYRGPASNYRLTGDFSYQNAITLLTAGYDVLVCRLCPGNKASGTIISAGNYDYTKGYAEGDYFYYGGKLVQAKIAIPAQSGEIVSFDPTKVYDTDSFVDFDGSIYKSKYTIPNVDTFEDGKIYAVGDIVKVVNPDTQEVTYHQCKKATDDGATTYSETVAYGVGDTVIRNDGTSDKVYTCIEATPDADLFAPDREYSVGELVVYNGAIYECVTTVPSNVPTFSDQDTYAVNDLVRYNDGVADKIYICTTAVTTAGAFDPSNWSDAWHKDFVAEDWTAYTNTWDDTAWSLKSFDSADWKSDWVKEFNSNDWDICTEAAETSEINNRIDFRAKYPGTFGNSIKVSLTRVPARSSIPEYWNLIVYIVDSLGTSTAVENLVFVLNEEDSTDSLLYVDEVESRFVDITLSGNLDDLDTSMGAKFETLVGGDDHFSTDGKTAEGLMDEAIEIAKQRLGSASWYVSVMESYKEQVKDAVTAETFKYREWLYTSVAGTKEADPIRCDGVYYILTDRLTYNPDVIVSPSWDDQDFTKFGLEPGEVKPSAYTSAIHEAIMYVAYYSRCAAGLIDVPRSLARRDVKEYFEGLSNTPGAGDNQFATHSAFFAPWGHFRYAGTGKANIASPSFQYLMILRSQISNQSIQYFWALPTNRKHNVVLGKLDYIVPMKELDSWQSITGVAINVITNIPDLGTNVWGNSTAWNVPPATYNALQNLSTRYLVDAIKNVCYRVGIGITFQYNNEQAYSKFYAGVTPLLDTMINVGAIDDYRVVMRADINGLDSVNANSVIGTILIAVHGVINDITIDLVALPASVDLNSISI